MVVEIPLTKGYVALVDDGDYDSISQHSWYAVEAADGLVYAARWSCGDKSTRKRLLMHRELFGSNESLVDHRDGNGLNNTRSNLRPANHSQNMANRKKHKNNSSGYIGVTRSGRDGSPWRACCYDQGKTIHVGVFSTAEEAAIARDAAAIALHGEFAKLNFPCGG